MASISTQSSDADSDIPESSIFSHENPAWKLAEAKVRNLAQNILEEFAKQSQVRRRLLLLSTELPNEAINLQHAHRYLAESASALMSTLESGAAQVAARQAIQQLHEDLERCPHGLSSQNRLQDEYRDLILASLSSEQGVSSVLKELASYLNIPMPEESSEIPPPRKGLTYSESSEEPEIHPLLKAYYEVSQQCGLARERLMDIEVEHEEHRTESEFLTDQGALSPIANADSDSHYVRRRAKACQRLQKLEMEQSEARDVV